MVKWKTIDELREIFINKYVNSDLQSELEKACSEEYELKRDYNGRQILELLQNVDDACESSATSNKVAVKLSYKDNVLEVGNTGTSFSDETIERLCLGRASEKSIKKIGNKGTGFRSLLNDAEWIEVHSGQYSIRFSEKFTQQLFNSYCDKNCTLIDRQRKNWKKDYPFCFPIMNCPKEIEFNSKNFDTLIRVKVKKDNEVKAASIQKQLQQPFYKSLLFLPNISKIIIDTELAHKEYSKIIDNDSILIEEKFTDEKANKVEEYFAYRRKAPINNKEADLIIAIPKDTHYDFSKEKLYCYFPIRSFTTPIHALIHAPFLTNNSRDDVPDDNEEINRKLFLEILSFSKEISEKLARKNLSELALKTVMPLKESKLWRSDSFNLQDSYFEILFTAKIFKTVNEDLISINDYPKIFDFAFPKEFIGDDFKELLIYQDYTSTQFIKELSEFIQYTEFNYSAQDLLEKISKLSNKASIKIRVKLFLWWSEHYNSQYLPHLLKDANDTWILKDSKIYLPTDTGVSSLPKELSWVRLCILKQDYVSELIFQLKKTKKNEWKETLDDYRDASNKRILAAFSREHLAVTFIEQSSSDLIESTINQQIDSLDKSKSFINWLFEKYSKNLQEGTELSIIKSLQLPDRDKNIRPINKLYLGEDYDNALAEKLFPNTDIKPFIQLEDIYNGTEKDVFLSFLKKCGIQEYPEIIKESLSDKDKFKDYVSLHYVTDIKINYLHSYAVKNFENLISTLSTDEIVEWLSRDFKLKNFIISFIISEEKDSYAQYGNSKRFFPSNAYIKFILNTSPWIELAGKKYPPCKIIKYGKLKDSVEGYYGYFRTGINQKIRRRYCKKIWI